MVTLHPRGILFDMDGVLVSSIGSVERTWEAWAKARGIDPAVAIKTAHGRRAIETVRLLRPDLNDMEELAWLEGMEVDDNGGLEMLDGVEPILEALPEKYWTVVTSATEPLARTRMEDGGFRVPSHIVTADDSHARKTPSGALSQRRRTARPVSRGVPGHRGLGLRRESRTRRRVQSVGHALFSFSGEPQRRRLDCAFS